MFPQIQPLLNLREILLATRYHQNVWVQWHPGMDLLIEDSTEESILSLPAKIVQIIGKRPVFRLHSRSNFLEMGNIFGPGFSESTRRYSLSLQMTRRIDW